MDVGKLSTENGKYATSRTTDVVTHSANTNYSNNEKSSEKIKLDFTDKKYLIPDEDTAPDNYPVEMSSKEANKWRRAAMIVSWISIIATLTIGIFEFVVAEKENSSAAFGLAFSAILDLLTSAVVLWRFYRSYNTFSMRREHISCIVLGVLFIVSSIGIAGKAIYGLLDGETPNMSEDGFSTLVITSIITTCLCSSLFVCKIIIAKHLSTWTVFTDALNSMAGAVIALSMVVTSEVTKSNHNMWFLDSTVGLLVSLLLLVYGLWLLTKHVPELRKTTSYLETK